MNTISVNKFYKYLQLIRFPNLFTIPSNIILGYLILANYAEYNFFHLFILIFSSLLLYISGMVFNDIFDIKIDRIERPKRPLPSGQVSKKTAYLISVGSMITANLLVLFTIGTPSLFITIIISVLILVYDIKIKKTFAGPLVMGLSRSFNILLGSSPFLFSIFTPKTSIQIIAIFLTIFFYVFLITSISRNETKDLKSKTTIHFFFCLIFLIIIAILILILTGVFNMISTVNLLFFLTVMIYLYFRTVYFSKSLQFLVTNMIVSLIFLDAIFISGLSDFYLSLLILLLCIPTIYLRKYFYLT